MGLRLRCQSDHGGDCNKHHCEGAVEPWIDLRQRSIDCLAPDDRLQNVGNAEHIAIQVPLSRAHSPVRLGPASLNVNAHVALDNPLKCD